MAVRDEFIITRNGKDFVLYQGLLDESHQIFSKWWEMETELVQVPSAENDMVAIVHAHFIGEPGDSTPDNPKVTKASGIGDASPDNVGRNIVPHIIRMAETRAKARALRDAVNVGATSVEELGEEGPEAPQQPREQPQAGAQRGAAKNVEAPPKGRRGELLKEVRDNLRLIHGDQWQHAERMIVTKSESQKPLHRLSEEELEGLITWTEERANKIAEESARAQADEIMEEDMELEPPF